MCIRSEAFTSKNIFLEFNLMMVTIEVHNAYQGTKVFLKVGDNASSWALEAYKEAVKDQEEIREC